jgi:putative inorganic carbon (HCO3(-)) transporter
MYLIKKISGVIDFLYFFPKNNKLLFFLIILFSILITFLSVNIIKLDLKYSVSILAIIAFFTSLTIVFFSIPEKTNIRIVFFLLFGFALGIPFNLDYNFFYTPYVGVSSIDVSFSLLCILAIYYFFIVDNKNNPIGFRNNIIFIFLFLLYILSCFLSLFNADFPVLSFFEIIRLITLFIIFYLIMNLQNKKQIAIVIFSLSVGIILQGIIAFYQFKTGKVLGLKILGEQLLIDQYLGYVAKRATGTIGHPNILGYYFEVLIPLMFAMFIAEKNFIVKLWYFLAMLLGILGIYTTLSRAAWITLPLSLSLVFLVMFYGKFLKIKTIMFVCFFLIIGTLMLGIMFPTIQKRFTFTDYGSASARDPLNQAAFSVIEQFPVFGVGANNMAKVFKTYDTTGFSKMFGRVEHVVHNMYLQIWAEIGTIGLLSFLSLFFYSIYTGISNLFKVSYWFRGVLVGATAGIMAQCLHCFFDPGYKTMMNVSMLIYTMLGLIACISILKRDNMILDVHDS